MYLAVGTTLGNYEVTGLLGSGGMGEVYRARDLKLKREVAIKVLPQNVSCDPDRISRFQREAQVLASLNHPNIAHIYGLEETNRNRCIVMELVEGDTLADLLKREPIPFDDAIRIAKEIAEALEAAHGKTIVHRDLKPANIKLTPEGRVKVLDFGLAKIFGVNEEDLNLSDSPTVLSQTGGDAVLGTAAYMSPEQARGKVVDSRSDVWSFGCVLYEMFAGKQTFSAETVSDTIVNILSREPDWTLLSDLPSGIRALVRRCLQKDIRRRVQHIGDARIEIEDIAAAGPRSVSEGATSAPTGRHRHAIVSWSIALLMTSVAGSSLWYATERDAPVMQPVVRFTMPFPTDALLRIETSSGLALSPDGTRVVYVADRGGGTQLYQHKLDQFDAVPISGTEGGNSPFFSPDGQWVGFFADDKLMKVSLTDGTILPICNVSAATARGASWGPDGTIVFGQANRGLMRAPASGGNAEVVAAGYWPHILPNGNDVLLTNLNRGSFDDAVLAVVSLSTGKVKNLNLKGTNPTYAPSGHLLFARTAGLWAVRFDSEHAEIRGEPVRVVQGVITSTTGGAGHYSLSGGGSLLYVAGSPSRGDLVWVDRQGKSTPLPFPPGIYADARLSPSGDRLAVTVDGQDVWIYDVVRGSRVRLTSGEGDSFEAIWKPDGTRVAFSSRRAGVANVFSKLADGRGQTDRLTSSEYEQYTSSWSPDGKSIFIAQSGRDGIDVWTVHVDGSQAKSEPFLNEQYGEWTPKISPDGRLLAYVSDESGRSEVYVQSFPDRNLKIPISTEGGAEPLWSRDGRELFYRNGDKLMAVSLTTTPTVSAARPRMLFEGRYELSAPGYTGYDIHPDGQRFVMIKPVAESSKQQMNFVLNWSEELKRIVPLTTKE